MTARATETGTRRIFRLAAVTAAVCLALAVPRTARAADIVFDDFDDGVLDPAWTVTVQNATGFTGSEAGTEYTVTDIAGVPAPPPPQLGSVTLSQSFAPVGDFTAEFDISWDASALGNAGVGSLEVQLLDANGDVVASIGIEDRDVKKTGRFNSTIDGVIHRGRKTLDLSGTAEFEIVRTGDTIEIYVDGVLFDSGTSDALITDVQIVYSFDKNKNSSSQSLFQPMGVDLLRISGAVPEPHHFTALALLGGLLLAVLRRRARWRTT